MAGWLHGVFVGEWLFVFPLCGFSLSLFCNYNCIATHSSDRRVLTLAQRRRQHVAKGVLHLVGLECCVQLC